MYGMFRDSSVGIEMCYRVDDRVSIPGKIKKFQLRSVHTSSEAHPASYPVGIGVSFPE
jgi:hypothetical protein